MQLQSLSVVLGFAVATLSAQTQTHGQMVGWVRDSSAVVWTRASLPCHASVQYATSPSFAGAAETVTVPALASRDNTVRVPLVGLQPATRYYYRIRLATTPGGAGQVGDVGWFETAPAPHQDAPVSFAFSGDSQTHAEFGIYDAIAAEEPDFFVSLGDFPYCDGATSLQDYWLEHQAVRSEPRWQFFARSVPVLGVWDDHEVVNNWDALTSPTLVTNGTQAFRDWYPIPDSLTGIYRKLRFGSGLEVFFVDTRRYRDVNGGLPSPQKTLLGSAQLQWLQQSLQFSTATFKVIATSVPTFYGGTDSWDGYVHERQQLLDFLDAQGIHNVVMIAADQHIAAIRELRCGLLEVQTGPLAQFVGGNTWQREPEQRWHGTQRNFAVVHVDPTVSPATMRIVFHDAQGNVLREHQVAAIGTPAELTFTSDVPEGGFVLADAPHYTRDNGSRATRERLHPGAQTLMAAGLPYGDGYPATIGLDVPDGADVRVAASYEDVPSNHPVLFEDAFDRPFGPVGNWQIVDLGSDGPSSWLLVDRALSQRSNIGGAAPAYGGTLAVAGDPGWTDYTCSMRFYSRDNDSCGLVFRYQDQGNYYRVRLDEQRQVAELTRFDNGQPTVLASRTNEPGFAGSYWHTVTVTAIGSSIRVWRNGEQLFQVTDGTHASGRIGLYAWADQLVSFDDVVVRAGDASARTRPRLFEADFANASTAGFTFVDQTSNEGPSQWSALGGTLRQLSNINDGDGTRDGLPKLGTVALAGPALADQEMHVRVRNDDNDAFGVVLRYVDEQNYYRFSIDAQRHYRRLVRVQQGVWTLLWEEDNTFVPGIWHQLQCSARGDRLRVVFDGETLCDVRDGGLTSGRAGLYCWASQPIQFDDVVVQEPPRPRAVTVALATPGQERLEFAAPDSAGELYLVALSASTSPGIPMSTLQPNDPRTWRLTNDPFFQLSLVPSPLLLQFFGTLDADGRATATVLWPPIASQLLGGAQLFAGGLTYDPVTSTYGELLPTVSMTIPR